MTLKDMRYISEIAAEKNITKAAAKLFVAQPALSQCIQKVERELGSAIFVRTTSGVTQTAEGESFIRFANKVLREQKQMEKQIEDIHNADRGEIRLGFPGTQATYVLPHILPVFKERYPHINIVLVEAASNEIEKRLAEGEIDVGILHLPILNQDLEWFELSNDRIVIVPRKGSVFQDFIYKKEKTGSLYLDIRFLEDEPIALTQPWQRSRMVTEQIFARAGILPKIKQVSRNISTLDALAQVDYATVLLPEKQLSIPLKNKGYYLIDEEYSVPYTFCAATMKGAYLSVAARKLLEFFREEKELF